MSLSNRAVPRYYGEFREKVLAGEIPVCREISMEMNRIDSLIADPNVYYDDEAINGFILFAERELTLTDGSDLHLLDSFKLWSEQLLSWYVYEERNEFQPPTPLTVGGWAKVTVKKRLVNKQYLIVARGAAKSMYASILQAYFLNIDTSTTTQITTAPTMKQADEVMAPLRTAIIRSRGPLFKFLTEGSVQNTTGSRALRQKLVPTKKGIENFLTGSTLEIRPMSVDKLQGARPKITTVDEWLSGDVREDVVGAIEQGASKVPDYAIVAISSEGTVRNGSGDTMKLELAKILKGEFYAPNVSIFHYKLDDVSEVGNPRMWPKANPNIGLTIGYDAYHADVIRAEQAPAARNDILAKRFGIPMEGFTYFFSYEETLKSNRRQNTDGMTCSLGIDLSQGDDFCAFTFLFPVGADRYVIKARSYITELTLNKLPGARRQKYEEFIREGSLVIMSGIVLDMMQIYEDLDQHINTRGYQIEAVGYDPYNASEFIERWELENGPFGIVKVPQGAKTESVPLGEIKTLSEEGNLIFDEEIVTFTMGNAITIVDTNGNRKLLKRRQEEKIDNVSALLDAYIAKKANQESFA